MIAMKTNKDKIILCLMESFVGICLLISPSNFTKISISIIGLAIVIYGIVSIVNYFRTEVVEAAMKHLLSQGLIAVIAGVFCICNPEWFIDTFPVLTVLYGITMLIAGIEKIQWTIDGVRMKKGRWYVTAINAFMTLLLAIVILLNPFDTMLILWRFIAVSLIFEAVFDLILLFVPTKKN